MSKINVKIYELANDTDNENAGILYEFDDNKYSENNLDKMVEIIRFNLEQDKFIQIYKNDDD